MDSDLAMVDPPARTAWSPDDACVPHFVPSSHSRPWLLGGAWHDVARGVGPAGRGTGTNNPDAHVPAVRRRLRHPGCRRQRPGAWRRSAAFSSASLRSAHHRRPATGRGHGGRVAAPGLHGRSRAPGHAPGKVHLVQGTLRDRTRGWRRVYPALHLQHRDGERSAPWRHHGGLLGRPVPSCKLGSTPLRRTGQPAVRIRARPDCP